MIAFTTRDETVVGKALQEIFTAEGMSSEVLHTEADNNGAGITRELVPLMDRLGGVLQKLGRLE